MLQTRNMCCNRRLLVQVTMDALCGYCGIIQKLILQRSINSFILVYSVCCCWCCCCCLTQQTHLTELTLSCNMIKLLPKEIKQLASLKLLDIRHNFLEVKCFLSKNRFNSSCICGYIIVVSQCTNSIWWTA